MSKLVVDGVGRTFPGVHGGAPTLALTPVSLTVADNDFGALANPADAAILLFKGDSPAVAERFAEADPYVKEGLVRRWWVREWTTVIGDLAEVRLPPGA